MALQSDEFRNGYTQALLDMYIIFDSHSNALYRSKKLPLKGVKFVLAVIDGIIKRRDTIMDIGPDKMNMFARKDNTVDFKEK